MVYRYDVKVKSETSQLFEQSYVDEQYGSIEQMLVSFKSEVTPQLATIILNAFAEQGITVTVRKIDYFSVSYNCFTHREDPYCYYRLYMEIYADVESDTNFMSSPLGPLIIVAIGLAIALIIAAFTVPPAFFDWLKSMTVKETTVVQYAWRQNPKTGEWEWVKVGEETVREPDIWGIMTVAAAIGLVIVVVGTTLYTVPRLLTAEK